MAFCMYSCMSALALCGLVLGMCLAQALGSGDNDRHVWVVFSLLLVLHQYSNYRLIRVLVFETLNPQRCFILTHLEVEARHPTCSNSDSDSNSSLQEVQIVRHSYPVAPSYLLSFSLSVGRYDSSSIPISARSREKRIDIPAAVSVLVRPADRISAGVHHRRALGRT